MLLWVTQELISEKKKMKFTIYLSLSSRAREVGSRVKGTFSSPQMNACRWTINDLDMANPFNYNKPLKYMLSPQVIIYQLNFVQLISIPGHHIPTHQRSTHHFPTQSIFYILNVLSISGWNVQ